MLGDASVVPDGRVSPWPLITLTVSKSDRVVCTGAADTAPDAGAFAASSSAVDSRGTEAGALTSDVEAGAEAEDDDDDDDPKGNTGLSLSSLLR